MVRYVVVFILLVFVSVIIARSAEGLIPQPIGNEAKTVSAPFSAGCAPMGKASLYVNALGAFQFGPIIGTEIGVGPDIFIDLHWRYSALGLIYALILTEGFEDYMSMGSMAFGGGARYFFKNKSSHRFYLGGFVEYGWGKTWSWEKDDEEWKGEEAQIVIVSNGGFRFRFKSGFFLNLGIYAGASIDVKDEWWYTNNPDDIYDARSTLPFGMLEFTLGWEFGRE